MEIEYRGNNRRPYADSDCFYTVRGIAGQSDETVQAAICKRFGVTEFWATNKLTDYRRLDDDSADFTITSPYLD